MVNSNKSSKFDPELFARWLDSRFRIPGTDIRFGLDPLIGLVPVAGDWITGIISLYLILWGIREEVSSTVLVRMGFNIFIDIAVGSIPLLGDLFDVGWKANIRNVRLIKQYHQNASSTEHRSSWILWLIGSVIIIVVIGLLFFTGWVIVRIVGAIF
jgi:hypothetical protein